MDNTSAAIRHDPDALQSRTISYLRFLMAFAVVLLHASNAGAKGDLPVYSTMCILLGEGLCRIAVPCFFLISGYLFFKNLEHWNWSVWGTKLRRRVHTLLIPYLLWNVLAAVLIYGYHWLRIRVGNGEPEALAAITSQWGPGGWRILWDCEKGMPLDYPLWFIRNLIFYTLATPLIYAFCKYLKGAGILLLGILLFGFLHWQENLFFYAAGAWLSLSGRNMLTAFHRFRWPAAALSLILLCCLPWAYRHDPTAYYYLLKSFILCGCVAAFALTGSGLRRGVLHDHPFLTRSAFFIFAAHGILILDDIARYVMLHLTASRDEFYYCADVVVRTVVTIALCLVLYRVLERFFPRLGNVLTGAKSRQLNGAKG